MSGEESASVSQECRRKALDLLARRPHFRRELESKLGQRGFPLAVIEHTLEWLADRGFVDDLDAARRWAAGAGRRKLFGPRRMRAELQRRGVDADIVSRVLDEEWTDGETERVRAAARSWLSRRDWDRDALGRHLERKGFSGAPIRSVLSELRAEHRETELGRAHEEAGF